MSDLLGSLPALQPALDDLARHHQVPGASLAIFAEGRTVEVVTGVANRVSGVEVTPETLFQIGSITKVYTTTLVMQLVDRGLVDLDQPVISYMPSFRLGDVHTTEMVTPRHLLSHSSGMVGDYLADHGPGDDCLERYVASLTGFEQVHRPGEMYSYCNAGFSVAGRLIEEVTGRRYHEVLSTDLLEPLRLRATTVLPEEMLRHRYAVGHTTTAGGSEPTAVGQVLMARSGTPAGSRTSATAADVVAFARFHLDGGRAPDGSQLVSEQSITAMQSPNEDLPTPGVADSHIGLGWMTSEWSGQRIISHSGGTIGQLAFLTVLPDRPPVVCLLTNSPGGAGLWRDLGSWIFRLLGDAEMPSAPTPGSSPPDLDLARYEGCYERFTCRFDVTADSDQLVATVTDTGDNDPAPAVLRLRPVDQQRFHTALDGHGAVVTFMAPDAQGRPGYLHFGGRAAARTATS